MILAADVGNTNIVVGCIKDEKVMFVERISTDVSKTELEYVVTLGALLDIYDIKNTDITGAIVASVVPPLNNILMSAIAKRFGIKPLLVGPGVKNGLKIRMDNPAQVGADLIVNAVAGLKYYGAPLVMIDMGTATTISALNAEGEYIGGAILPGVKVSLDSLVNRTSQLPKISLDPPDRLIATNTIDSMKSGIIFGQASCIDGMIERTWEEMGCEAKAVATGGLSGKIIPFCKHDIIYDNELTLKGLGVIWHKNNP